MRVKKKPILAITIMIGLVHLLKFLSNRHRQVVKLHEEATSHPILITSVAKQDPLPTTAVQTTQLLTTQPDLEFRPKVGLRKPEFISC